MFQDEARFGRMVRIRRCRVPAPARPVVDHGYEREFTYVYGVVSPVEGELDWMPSGHELRAEWLCPKINAGQMGDFWRRSAVDTPRGLCSWSLMQPARMSPKRSRCRKISAPSTHSAHSASFRAPARAAAAPPPSAATRTASNIRKSPRRHFCDGGAETCPENARPRRPPQWALLHYIAPKRLPPRRAPSATRDFTEQKFSDLDANCGTWAKLHRRDSHPRRGALHGRITIHRPTLPSPSWLT